MLDSFSYMYSYRVGITITLTEYIDLRVFRTRWKNIFALFRGTFKNKWSFSNLGVNKNLKRCLPQQQKIFASFLYDCVLKKIWSFYQFQGRPVIVNNEWFHPKSYLWVHSLKMTLRLELIKWAILHGLYHILYGISYFMGYVIWPI